MLKIVTQAHSFLSFWKKLCLFIHTDLSMQKVLFEKVLLKKTFKKLTGLKMTRVVCLSDLFEGRGEKGQCDLLCVEHLSMIGLVVVMLMCYYNVGERWKA